MKIDRASVWMVVALVGVGGCSSLVRPSTDGGDGHVGLDSSVSWPRDAAPDQDAARRLAATDGERWRRNDYYLHCGQAGYHDINELALVWEQADASQWLCAPWSNPARTPSCLLLGPVPDASISQYGMCLPDQHGQPWCLRPECMSDADCVARIGRRSACLCAGTDGPVPPGGPFNARRSSFPVHYCSAVGGCLSDADCSGGEVCYPSVIASCNGDRIEGYFCSSPGDECHGPDLCSGAPENPPDPFWTSRLSLYRSRSACRYQPSAGAFRCQAAADCP